MDAASLYFGRRLMEMIQDKQAEWSKPLMLGQALDWGDYKHRAGYLKGLADVVSMMKAITLEDEDTHAAG